MRRSISYRVNQIDTAMLQYNKEPLQTSLTMPKLSKLASIAEKSEKADEHKPELVEDVVIHILDFFNKEEKWNLYLNAVERKDMMIMRWLLKRNVRQLGGRYRGPYGHRLSSNVLIHSIEEGNNLVLKEVLKWYPDANRYDLRVGTALSLAASRNLITLVETLMNDPGIDINAQWRQSDTALMKACEMNHMDVVKLLLNDPRIDLNAQNAQGHTALWAAAINDRMDIFTLLLSRSELDIGLKTVDGNTLIMTCSANNKIDCLKALLLHPDANVNDVNVHLETALSRAVRRGHAQVVNILLQQPDLDMTYRNIFGQNIMDIANSANKVPNSVKEMLRRKMYTAPKSGVNYCKHYSSAAASAAAVAKYRNSIPAEQGREPNTEFTHHYPYSVVAADAAIVAQYWSDMTHWSEQEKESSEEQEEQEGQEPNLDFTHHAPYNVVAAHAAEMAKQWNEAEKES